MLRSYTEECKLKRLILIRAMKDLRNHRLRILGAELPRQTSFRKEKNLRKQTKVVPIQMKKRRTVSLHFGFVGLRLILCCRG
jgi:hypothetical protein